MDQPRFGGGRGFDNGINSIVSGAKPETFDVVSQQIRGELHHLRIQYRQSGPHFVQVIP